MRILYFVIGLLVGMSYTADIGIAVVNAVSKQFDKDITAYSLTGMDYGWSRGREYTEAKIYWMVEDCMAELGRKNVSN